MESLQKTTTKIYLDTIPDGGKSQTSIASTVLGFFRQKLRHANGSDGSLIRGLEMKIEVIENCSGSVTPVRKSSQVRILIAGFLVVFQVFGLSQSYGIFQDYHTSHVSKEGAMIPDKDAKNKAFIAAIGSLGPFSLPQLLGSLMTPAIRKVPDVRWLTIPGAVLFSLGYVAAGYSKRSWHLFLSQGLLAGIGATLIYCPIVNVAPEYFPKRQGLAIGIIGSGACASGFIYGPLIEELIKRIGIRKAFLALGLMSFVICGAAALLPRSSRHTGSSRSSFAWETARTPKFILCLLLSLFNGLAFGIPFSFGPEFSNSLRIKSNFGALLLAIMNGMAIFRIPLGFAGDKFGYQNVLGGSLGMCLSCTAVLWFVAALNGSKWMWILFSVLFGIFACTYLTITMSVITALFGIDQYLAVIGHTNAARGIGMVAGPSLAGMIARQASPLDLKPLEYSGLVVFVIVLFVAQLVVLFGLRWLDSRENGWKKFR